MDIEEAFLIAGRMGRYQVILTAISYFGNILYGSQLLIMVIVGATPNKDVPSERNLTTIVTEWDLYDKPWVISLLGSLFLAGYIVGSFLFGQLPDLYGRKPIFLINAVLSSISCFCSAFCQNWHTFALARFLGGLFAGGASGPAFVIMCELVGRDIWGSVGYILSLSSPYWALVTNTILGMLFQLFFSCGIMMVGLLGYIFKNWRDVIMVSSGLSAIMLPFFIFLVPESPRWLYSTGQTERAEKIIKEIARKNGKDDSIITLKTPEDVDADATDFHKHSIVDVVRNKTLLKLLVAVAYVWFASSLAYYGLSVDLSILMPNVYVGTVLSGAVEMPAYIITLFLLDSKWFGRHGTMMFLLLFTSLSSTCILFTGGAGHWSVVKTVFGLTSKLSIAAAFSVMFIYVSEMFPTQVRTVALVVGNTTARIGGVIAFFVPLLGDIQFFLPYAVYGAATVIAGAVTLALPETLKKQVVMSDFVSPPKQNNPKTSTQTEETKPLLEDSP